LIPEDLRVQLLGDSSAVVTSRLSNADRIARRTLVLEKLGNGLVYRPCARFQRSRPTTESCSQNC
jgi:hypothetical protein